MELIINGLDWSVEHNGKVLLCSDSEHPFLFIGHGKESVDMYRGNYKIEDYVIDRVPLNITEVKQSVNGANLSFGDAISVLLTINNDCCELAFEQHDSSINRFWMRVCADQDEAVWGCGEQMSYFNLRSRHFPLWTSEPGVGRDKTTFVTWRSDVENKAGGDYYNTNYPQTTFVSSNHYYLHADTTAYADFDFRNSAFHELQIWEVPAKVRIECADTFTSLLEKETAYFGRQPELPEWVYNGLIIGAQGGNDRSFGILEKTIEHDIPVAALWCQDWCGKRVTSFGKRLQWDWRAHDEMYPGLKDKIQDLHNRGIKFMGYINPYLVEDGELFREGLENDVFARKSDGSIYLVDFGEFNCGVIDLTKPEAYNWFKNRVIKHYSIDIGIDGWMADFGEYLPTDDIILASGKSAMIEHNHWPALWAKCNYDAVSESGKLGEIVYFMRAGATGSQKYCTLLWAGDQSVDFSRHDGLCTTITAALSSGMSGCGLNHSDIGGYTSLFDNTRTKEVFLRWAEAAAFTPVMRTHEGNRPDTNFQYYDDDDCMDQLARITKIHTALTPYIRSLVKENSERGIPVQRPLFLQHENDTRTYSLNFEYMLGDEMIVAPVWQEGIDNWDLYLPEGEWIHLWTGKEYSQGDVSVPAKLGYTPVFYKKNAKNAELFASIAKQFT